MFPITNIFYFRIPALSTVAALPALVWGWAQHTCCTKPRLVLGDDTGRVWPAVWGLHVHHRRAEPDHQVAGAPVEMVLDPCFTGRHPVTL